MAGDLLLSRSREILARMVTMPLRARELPSQRAAPACARLILGSVAASPTKERRNEDPHWGCGVGASGVGETEAR